MNIYTVPEGVTRFPATVGCAIRRDFRRLLQREGIEFTEDKGWFESQFVLIEPDAMQLATVITWIEKVNED